MITEILTLITITILFTLIFIVAFLALFYVLINFVLGQIDKLRKDKNGLAVTASFGKVIIVSFLSFSFFIYSASFLLRIEGDVFRQERSIRTAETTILPEKKPPLLSGENSESPLFDLVIQAAAEQNEKRQLTFVLAGGSIFALAAIAAMGGYLAYLSKDDRRYESR